VRIVLVPIGAAPSELLDWLVDRLGDAVGTQVLLDEGIPLPAAAYDARRGQYGAGIILSVLCERSLPPAARVVGLAEADCYAPGLNFIFGQALMNGRAALVALPRLRQSFYGLPEDGALFRERVLKEVVHELGHTWGLAHCADARCVMHFSNTLHDTDVKGAAFCAHCRARLTQAGRASPVA
jgi:archaemetzincin